MRSITSRIQRNRTMCQKNVRKCCKDRQSTFIYSMAMLALKSNGIKSKLLYCRGQLKNLKRLVLVHRKTFLSCMHKINYCQQRACHLRLISKLRQCTKVSVYSNQLQQKTQQPCGLILMTVTLSYDFQCRKYDMIFENRDFPSYMRTLHKLKRLQKLLHVILI